VITSIHVFVILKYIKAWIRVKTKPLMYWFGTLQIAETKLWLNFCTAWGLQFHTEQSCLASVSKRNIWKANHKPVSILKQLKSPITLETHDLAWYHTTWGRCWTKEKSFLHGGLVTFVSFSSSVFQKIMTLFLQNENETQVN